MRNIKIIDIKNLGFDFIASRATSSDLVFATNYYTKQKLRSYMLKYGKRNIIVDVPYSYFSSIVRKSYRNYYQITNSIYKSNKYSSKSTIDRKRYISILTKMLHTQKATMIEDDDKFYETFSFWEFIPQDEYKKFKEYYNDVGFTDIFDILKYVLQIQFNKTIENLYIMHLEDVSPLLLEVIKKCINARNIYFIGDEYKIKPLYSRTTDIEFSEVIDLYKMCNLPMAYYKTFEKIKKSIELPYEVNFIQSDAKIVTAKSFYDAMSYVKNNGFDSCAIVYDFPLFCNTIEPILFRENIPFLGIMPEYKINKDLYIIFKVMVNVMNKKEPVTFHEIRTLIKSLNGNITDKFGGFKKLLAKFNLPVISSQILSNTSFFGYLIKAWIDKNFDRLLQPELSRQWHLWKHKMSEKWLQPKVICNTVVATKGLEFDVVIYVQYSTQSDYNSLYTCLTMANKKLVLTNY